MHFGCVDHRHIFAIFDKDLPIFTGFQAAAGGEWGEIAMRQRGNACCELWQHSDQHLC